MTRKISFGCDHRGFEVKTAIFKFLEAEGFEVIDCGTNSGESCDYTDFILDAAKRIETGECELGIGVCYTGVGSAIAANKVKGVRAALVEDVQRAELARAHNNSNMLILASGFLSEDEILNIMRAWLNASFEEGRHSRRVDKITEYENQN